MLRTRNHKIVNYDGYDLRELFDLEKGTYEFDNLLEDTAYIDLRFESMKKASMHWLLLLVLIRPD